MLVLFLDAFEKYKADKTVSSSAKLQLTQEFAIKKNCCVGRHLGTPMKKQMTEAHDFLPQGRLHTKLCMMFRGKNCNVEIENNFARAACARKCMRGRNHSSLSAIAKHVCAEIKLGHKRSLRHAIDSGVIQSIGNACKPGDGYFFKH